MFGLDGNSSVQWSQDQTWLQGTWCTVVLKVLHTGRMTLYKLSCTFVSGKPRATGLKLAFSLFLSAH